MASAADVARHAGDLVAGTARTSEPVPWHARHNLTSAQYQAEFDRLTGRGYRLVHVDGYEAGGRALYAAIWERSSGPAWIARHGLTSAQYQTEFDRLVRLGYRLVHVDGYGVGREAQYAAIWDRSSGPAWVARHGLTSAQYQAEFDRLTGQGYRLTDVSGYRVGREAQYAAIWERSSGPARVARHGLTSAQYQAEFDRLTGRGYRLVHVDGYEVGGRALYAAIWERTGGSAWVARHGLTSAQYQAEFDRLVRQGYRLSDVSGYGAGSPRFAALWLKETTDDGVAQRSTGVE
ncbi:hypothetical protein [Streptosporangium sp. 'caverna']|uniref:hypothetical protein n=1 Tax=Streptosporangium sp. 'caverna' TaxID=2202249 RepID=UPI00195518F6|nr:hypothetical protein [Streptosporangium sp. 'caverna']